MLLLILLIIIIFLYLCRQKMNINYDIPQEKKIKGYTNKTFKKIKTFNDSFTKYFNDLGIPNDKFDYHMFNDKQKESKDKPNVKIALTDDNRDLWSIYDRVTNDGREELQKGNFTGYEDIKEGASLI